MGLIKSPKISQFVWYQKVTIQDIQYNELKIQYEGIHVYVEEHLRSNELTTEK